MTDFTWLLEAAQPHQHCSSDHPGPALPWRAQCVRMGHLCHPCPARGTPRDSRMFGRESSHTCSPGHSSASFWMMNTTATRNSQANWNPSRQKENLLLSYSPQPQQPRRFCCDPHITSSPQTQLSDNSISPVNQSCTRNLMVCWSPTWVPLLLIT